MSYTSLGRVAWGSSPTIYCNVYYDYQRSGSSMQYKVRLVVEGIGGASYFGYPIYQIISLDGAQKASSTLKSASPSQWSDITYETGWLTVSNKTSGTTSLKVNLYSGSGSSRDTTYSFSLIVSPAASKLGAVSDFNVGSYIAISITKYNSNFTDNLAIKYGSTTIRTVSGITSGYVVKFTTAELNTIYGLMSTVKSGTFTFILTTLSGGSTLGTSTRTAKGTITNAAPTLSATVVDTNADTIALTGDSNILVKYQSTAYITITASGNKGATITSKKVNGTTVSGDTLTINNVSIVPFTIIVTDSRGNTTTVVLSPEIVDYIPLTLSASFWRPAPTTGEIALQISGKYYNGSFGAATNSLTLSWAYRLYGDASWTNGGTLVDGTDYTISSNTFSSGTISLGTIFDYTKAYELIVYYEDIIASYDTGGIRVNKGTPVFDWGEDNFNINVPVIIVGKSLADYIAEYGTSGIWYYRKWASGRVEAWTAVNVSAPASTLTTANVAVPEGIFTAAPNKVFTTFASGTSSNNFGNCLVFSRSSGQTMTNVVICVSNTHTAAFYPVVLIYAIREAV